MALFACPWRASASTAGDGLQHVPFKRDAVLYGQLSQQPQGAGTGRPNVVSNESLQVQFSPDGRWIATASFDKGVKLWDGFKGSFVATFRQVAMATNSPPPAMLMAPVLQPQAVP